MLGLLLSLLLMPAPLLLLWKIKKSNILLLLCFNPCLLHSIYLRVNLLPRRSRMCATLKLVGLRVVRGFQRTTGKRLVLATIVRRRWDSSLGFDVLLVLTLLDSSRSVWSTIVHTRITSSYAVLRVTAECKSSPSWNTLSRWETASSSTL